MDSIWIASFDIGIKNFAFYIEEIDSKSISEIKNISKQLRYKEDGTPTPHMKKILNKVCFNGKTILHKNSDISQNCVKGKCLDPEAYYNMIDLLDSYSEYWDKCSMFVIEQQMNFGKQRNTMAVKLGQHCYSYFAFRYGRFKKIFEFPSYHKTCVLGAEKTKGKQYKNGRYKWKTMDKPARKKWSIMKATEILTERGEKETINNIKTKKKKDDLADTLTQLQAFKYLFFVEKSII